MQDNYTTLATAGTSELGPVRAIGQVANEAARQHVFDDYQSRKATSTLQAQHADLSVFCAYLAHVQVRIDVEELASNPDAWQGMTWGLVEGFVKWMLAEGYAIGSVNRKLSTVKSYCKLAAKAGAIPADELAMIRICLRLWAEGGKARRRAAPDRQARGQKGRTRLADRGRGQPAQVPAGHAPGPPGCAAFGPAA